jgi:hypothetical protein
MIIVTAAGSAQAFRPFVTSDASVVETGTFASELGIVTAETVDSETRLTIPSILVKYGIVPGWEIGAGLDIRLYAPSETGTVRYLNLGLYAQRVLRAGFQQDKAGPSTAIGLGMLLPSGFEEERKTGWLAFYAFSSTLSRLAYYLNAGAVIDRTGSGPNGLWGIIAEYPFEGRVRIAAEIDGTVNRYDVPVFSGLIGVIVTAGGTDFDLGVRQTRAGSVTDHLVTMGATFKL